MKHPHPFIISVLILALAVTLLISSDEAEAGGTGSWPYVAGNWEVLLATEVWDETITVTGDVMIHPVGSLELNNATLEVQGAGGVVILDSTWFLIENQSDLTCDVISGQTGSVCRIYDTNVTPYTTSVELRFWEVNNWVDINQSSIQSTYGQFQESSEVQFRNSSFLGFPSISGALFKFFEATNVNVTDSTFTNLSDDTLFFIYQENANITDNTFLSCDTIYQVTNGTVTFTDNSITHFLTVEVVDAFLQPVGGARVVVFNEADVSISDRTSNASGLVEWIECTEVVGTTDHTPHLIVVERLGNFAEAQVRITESTAVQIRLREYEQKVQVAVLMRNNWTKEKIEFGQLQAYLNLPSLIQDDDYLVFDWNNYVYYPTTYVNITIFDWFDRIIWWENQTITYSQERIEVVATINYTTIKIVQYDIDTLEPLDLIPEFNLTLEEPGNEVTLSFAGNEVAVPEIEGGNNNYRVSWEGGTNYTEGEQKVEVKAQKSSAPSSSQRNRGVMLANIGVKSKASVIKPKSDPWYMILKEPYVWVTLTIIAIVGAFLTWKMHFQNWWRKRSRIKTIKKYTKIRLPGGGHRA